MLNKMTRIMLGECVTRMSSHGEVTSEKVNSTNAEIIEKGNRGKHNGKPPSKIKGVFAFFLAPTKGRFVKKGMMVEGLGAKEEKGGGHIFNGIAGGTGRGRGAGASAKIVFVVLEGNEFKDARIFPTIIEE
jgi:hypothetical protein